MATKDSGKGQPRRAGRVRTEDAPLPPEAPRPTRRKAPAKDTSAPASPGPTPTTGTAPARRRQSTKKRAHADRAAEAESALPITQAEAAATLPAPGATSESIEPATTQGAPPGETREPASEALPASQAEAVTAPDRSAPSAEATEPAEEEDPQLARPERARGGHGNALGSLIEQQFTAPGAPCRSYSDLERRSGISREALSRYVTARPDRRRSPTIDTLVAIADAVHLSLLEVCRAAAASVRGVPLPSPEVQQGREGILSSLIAGLSDDQFNAVVELLRQMHPIRSSAS